MNMFHDVYVSEFTAKSRLLTVLYFSVKSWRLRAHRYEGRLSLFQMYQRGGRWGSQRGGEERTEKKRAPGNDFTDNKRTVNSELEK